MSAAGGERKKMRQRQPPASSAENLCASSSSSSSSSSSNNMSSSSSSGVGLGGASSDKAGVNGSRGGSLGKRGSGALSSSSSGASLQMSQNSLGASFGILSMSGETSPVPCAQFVTPAVLAERARILRLPQREREREVHEWHCNRERDLCRQQVPLHEIWEKVFAYGINVLREGEGEWGGRPLLPAEQLKQQKQQTQQPTKLRKTGAFSSGAGQDRGDDSGSQGDETEREDSADMEEDAPAPALDLSVAISASCPPPAAPLLSKASKAVLHAIINRVNSPYPYSYGGADQTPILYGWLLETVRDHLLTRVLPPLEHLRDVPLLHAFLGAWEAHKAFTRDLWVVFSSLDRNCCAEKKLPSVTSASLRAFHEHVFSPVKREVRASVLHLIRQIRDEANAPQTAEVAPAVSFLPNSRGHSLVFEHVLEESAAQQRAHALGTATSSPLLGSPASLLLGRAIFVNAALGHVMTRADLRCLQDLPSSFATTPVDSLALYSTELEAAFLEDSLAYYEQQSTAWLRSGDICAYMRQVERLCNNESAFAHAHLHSSTCDRLVSICVVEAVARRKDVLLARVAELLNAIFAASAVVLTVTSEQVHELQRAYDLCRYTAYCIGGPLAQAQRLSLIDAADLNLTRSMADAFCECIKRSGRALVEQRRAEVARMAAEYEQWQGGSRLSAPPKRPSANDSELVEGLLRLQASCQRICSEIFKGDALYANALREGLDESINDRLLERPSPVEILAAHCHKLLKKGKQARPESELEQELTACLELFQLSRDKDIFEESYRIQLADRLFARNSAGVDFETMAVRQMRAVQGPSFTTKMESMLTDCAYADELCEKFGQWGALQGKVPALPEVGSTSQSE